MLLWTSVQAIDDTELCRYWGSEAEGEQIENFEAESSRSRGGFIIDLGSGRWLVARRTQRGAGAGPVGDIYTRTLGRAHINYTMCATVRPDAPRTLTLTHEERKAHTSKRAYTHTHTNTFSLLPLSLSALTGQGVRKLIKDGLIIRKPQAIHSRARVNRRLEAKRKGRHTGTGKRQGTADARMPVKVIWIRRQRVLRCVLFFGLALSWRVILPLSLWGECAPFSFRLFPLRA